MSIQNRLNIVTNTKKEETLLHFELNIRYTFDKFHHIKVLKLEIWFDLLPAI